MLHQIIHHLRHALHVGNITAHNRHLRQHVPQCSIGDISCRGGMGLCLLDRGIRRLSILQRIDVGDGRKRRDRLLLVSLDFLRLLVEIQTDDAPGNDQ